MCIAGTVLFTSLAIGAILYNFGFINHIPDWKTLLTITCIATPIIYFGFRFHAGFLTHSPIDPAEQYRSGLAEIQLNHQNRHLRFLSTIIHLYRKGFGSDICKFPLHYSNGVIESFDHAKAVYFEIMNDERDVYIQVISENMIEKDGQKAWGNYFRRVVENVEAPVRISGGEIVITSSNFDEGDWQPLTLEKSTDTISVPKQNF